MSTHYKTEWFNRERQMWVTSSIGRRLTLEEAKKQMANDAEYFWEETPLRIVEVTEQILEAATGRAKRPAFK